MIDDTLMFMLEAAAEDQMSNRRQSTIPAAPDWDSCSPNLDLDLDILQQVAGRAKKLAEEGLDAGRPHKRRPIESTPWSRTARDAQQSAVQRPPEDGPSIACGSDERGRIVSTGAHTAPAIASVHPMPRAPVMDPISDCHGLLTIRSLEDPVRWISMNSFFGRILEIHWTSHLASILFESVHAAYLYLGLLRFGRSKIPTVHTHFTTTDLKSANVQYVPRREVQGSRTLVITDRNGGSPCGLIRQIYDGDHMHAVIGQGRDNATIFLVLPSIREASDVMALIDAGRAGRSLPRRYGCDPSAMSIEIAGDYSIAGPTELACIRRAQYLEDPLNFERELERSLASQASPRPPPALQNGMIAVETVKKDNSHRTPWLRAVGSAHAPSTCTCLMMATGNGAVRERLRRRLMAAQKSARGQWELSRLESDLTCICGLRVCTRGKNNTLAYVPFAPESFRCEIFELMHVKNGNHLSAETTCGRSEQIIDWEADGSHRKIAVMAYVRSSACCGQRSPRKVPQTQDVCKAEEDTKHMRLREFPPLPQKVTTPEMKPVKQEPAA